MLQLFRKHVTSVASKIILTIVIISFVLFWGIGDVLRGGSKSDVARVGNQSINRAFFARSLQQAIHQVEEKTHKKMDSETIFASGLVPFVLNELIQGILLDQEAERLGLMVPDASLRETVQSINFFQDQKGNFSREKLQDFLTQSRLSERKFIETLSQDLRRQQLLQNLFTKPLANRTWSPRVLSEIMTHYGFDIRRVQLCTLLDEEIGPLSHPSKEDLRKFYEKEAEDFVIPEKRTFSVAWLDPKKKESHPKIPLERIKKFYEENKSSFQTKPQRVILFVSFDQKKKAQEMADHLKAGKSLEAVLKELKIKKPSMKMVSVSAEQSSIDGITKIWEKSVGFYTKPFLKGKKWIVGSIKEEKQGRQLSLEESRLKIQEKLTEEENQNQLSSHIQHLDDELASGTSLADVSRHYGMSFVRIQDFHETQEPADLKLIPADFLPDVLKQAMSLSKGETSPLIQVKGCYVVVQLDSITDKRTPNFEEIKNDILKGWEKRERRKKTEALAEQMLKEIKEGASFEKIAKTRGKKIKVVEVNAQKPFVDSQFLSNQIMQMNQGDSVWAHIQGGVSLVRLEGITPISLEEKDQKKICKILSRQIEMGLLDGYMNRLKEETKIVTYPRVIQGLFK